MIKKAERTAEQIAADKEAAAARKKKKMTAAELSEFALIIIHDRGTVWNAKSWNIYGIKNDCFYDISASAAEVLGIEKGNQRGFFAKWTAADIKRQLQAAGVAPYEFVLI